ncbi:hypothetical protein HERIO_2768 [Hepatospora eriocheir]|uniref:Uncharacterized protein n=1 Tax=Hepatospora eriocheir TaxID=1081669 RepID=A0A1X0Q9X0_9MICR|nr:hypothetical protein HERIO_2768 [Hepatospora eriocheir]
MSFLLTFLIKPVSSDCILHVPFPTCSITTNEPYHFSSVLVRFKSRFLYIHNTPSFRSCSG